MNTYINKICNFLSALLSLTLIIMYSLISYLLMNNLTYMYHLPMKKKRKIRKLVDSLKVSSLSHFEGVTFDQYFELLYFELLFDFLKS